MSLDRNADTLGTFFMRLGATRSRLLILDYDGTLAPLVADRHRAVPYDWVPGRLERLAATGTRVVIVSGRPVAELVRLLPVDPLPELWGSHGWERRIPGAGNRVAAVPEEQTRRLSALAEAAGARAPAERIERKTASVAVHVRGMPTDERRRILEGVRAAWHGLDPERTLRVEPFDGGIEARVPGRDKGSAVLEVVADAPGDATVAYLGDDLTDEDAFSALEGRALTILVRSEPRPTRASLRLSPPHELQAFLDEWIRICSGEEAPHGTALAPPRASEMSDASSQAEKR